MTSADKAQPQPWRWGDAIRWVLYDFANTAFAMVVLALVFPRMFKVHWAAGLDPAAESVAYKVAQAVPCLLVFCVAPFLGQLASSSAFRARGLRIAVFAGALLTALLGWVPAGGWLAAALLYTGAAALFYVAATFYDSMLVDCAPPGRRHVLSGAAFSAGFIAGILILVALHLGVFAGRMWMIYPAAAAWWCLFALPLVSRSGGTPTPLPALGETWADTRATAGEIWGNLELRWFLVAFILYIDGVHAVKTTATHLGTVLGYGEGDLILAFFVVQAVGVPAALGFGWLGHRFGAPRILITGLVVYTLIALFGARMQPGDITVLGATFPRVWLLAGAVGLVQGGVQGLSRSHFASLVPAGREAAYFGFYGMIGRFASFLGPLLGAVAGWVLADPADPTSAERWGFASFALLFALGIAGVAMSSEVRAWRADASA
ncbi:MAG: MFS transporter [Opitutales bacterium]